MKSMKRNRTNKKLQNPEDRSISFPRVLTMIILAIISAAAVSFMLMTSNILLDDGIIAILISIVFGALFLGITLSNRIHNQRIYSGTGYRSLFIFYDHAMDSCDLSEIPTRENQYISSLTIFDLSLLKWWDYHWNWDF